ncbi:MAG: nitroreductase family protein [Anaerovoracaceae bacterium]
MEAFECIDSRRSIRKFTEQPVSEETIRELVTMAGKAPSWKNTQVVRYTAVMDKELKDKIAEEAVLGYPYNTKTIHAAPVLMVQSIVTGISGYEKDGTPTTPDGSHWQSFDGGLSAMAFCLAANAKGLGTVIQGIIDSKKTAELIGLPEDQKVTAFISLGYPAKVPDARPRKTVDEILTIKK